MKKREVTIIPPLKLLCENGEFRKYRVGGYMKAVYNGHPAFMDRKPLYDFFEDVVSQYPNWELTDVYEDIIIDVKTKLTTFHGIISAIQMAKQKKIDILLIKSYKDLVGTTSDIPLMLRMLSDIGIKTLFILDNLHYSSPFDVSCCNELPFELKSRPRLYTYYFAARSRL
jgi:hypothetical protein